MRNLVWRVALAQALAWSGAMAERVDVIVYGDTGAAVASALEVRRQGRTVRLISPEKHIGGMLVEGLGSSDINNHWFRNDVAIGGWARDFYRRLGRHYGAPGPVYLYEPHVAEQVLAVMLAEAKIEIVHGRLREPLRSAVRKRGAAITAITLEDGSSHNAAVFIDATIEGDLLAAAGVETIVGREANAQYGESKNGIRGENTYRQFPFRLDPYRTPGDPASGLLPTIQDEPLGTPGAGDHRIQGYCFRSCLTRDPANQIAFAKPAGYDPHQYELYRRYAARGGELFAPQARLPHGKTDLGSWHDLSANLYGMNHEYPAGAYATRRRVYEEHRSFVAGLFWFLQNDPDLPEKLRAKWRGWGLCRDEFTDNGGWPRRLYVRDARRMVSDFVITEQHTRRVNAPVAADPVAVAYWPTDTHHVRRIVRDGAVYNEGFVFDDEAQAENAWGPFGISYRALVPRRNEANNLLTPTSISSSHVAYGAIRLEWTFMALGQAAGAAAALASQTGGPVQDVPYARLRELLLKGGQVVSLNIPEPKPKPE
jgi:hypothetical protein